MALFSHHNNQEWELGQTSVEVGCGVGGTDPIAALGLPGRHSSISCILFQWCLLQVQMRRS